MYNPLLGLILHLLIIRKTVIFCSDDEKTPLLESNHCVLLHDDIDSMVFQERKNETSNDFKEDDEQSISKQSTRTPLFHHIYYDDQEPLLSKLTPGYEICFDDLFQSKYKNSAANSNQCTGMRIRFPLCPLEKNRMVNSTIQFLLASENFRKIAVHHTNKNFKIIECMKQLANLRTIHNT